MLIQIQAKTVVVDESLDDLMTQSWFNKDTVDNNRYEQE